MRRPRACAHAPTLPPCPRDPLSTRGIGDRWLAGETLEGIAFGPGAAVQAIDGPRTGTRGTIRLLVGLAPEPMYLVATSTGDARLRQSQLRAAG